MIGQTVSHYRIIEKLGMGEVYRAEDTHLRRAIAITLVPPSKMADPERKRRFTHEARAASALNNIQSSTVITGRGNMRFHLALLSIVAFLAQLAALAGQREPAAINAAGILQHIRVLASDDFQGRKPGTPGEDKTVSYLVQQFKAMRLKAGNRDGTYIEKVPLVGITPTLTPLILTMDSEKVILQYKKDYVAWTRRVTDRVALESSDLIFLGYGVQAPEGSVAEVSSGSTRH